MKCTRNGADIRFIQQLLGLAALSRPRCYTQVAIWKLKEIRTATHPAKFENTVLHELKAELEDYYSQKRQKGASKIKDTEIEFNVDDLLNSVEQVRDHVTGQRKVTVRTTQVKLPDPAPLIIQRTSPKPVMLWNVSQPGFARLSTRPDCDRCELGKRRVDASRLEPR
jgi:hypothetical protein